MGSSEVIATPSAALPQPRPGKTPAGQDPKRAFAASKSPQQHSDQTRKPVKSEQDSCSFDGNHSQSLALSGDPVDQACGIQQRCRLIEQLLDVKSDFKPLLMKARPGACAGRELSKIEISRPNRLRRVTQRLRCCDVNAWRGRPGPRPLARAFDRPGRPHIAANAAATGGANRATAIGFVSAFSRLPVHPANRKANSRAMILIRAIYRSFISLSGFSWGTRSALDGRRSRYRYFELEASLKCRSCKKGAERAAEGLTLGLKRRISRRDTDRREVELAETDDLLFR